MVQDSAKNPVATKPEELDDDTLDAVMGGVAKARARNVAGPGTQTEDDAYVG